MPPPRAIRIFREKRTRANNDDGRAGILGNVDDRKQRAGRPNYGRPSARASCSAVSYDLRARKSLSETPRRSRDRGGIDGQERRPVADQWRGARGTTLYLPRAGIPRKVGTRRGPAGKFAYFARDRKQRAPIIYSLLFVINYCRRRYENRKRDGKKRTKKPRPDKTTIKVPQRPPFVAISAIDPRRTARAPAYLCVTYRRIVCTYGR